MRFFENKNFAKKSSAAKTSTETQELLAEAESALSHSEDQPAAPEPEKKAATPVQSQPTNSKNKISSRTTGLIGLAEKGAAKTASK